MIRAVAGGAVAAVLGAAAAHAEEAPALGRRAATAERPQWTLAATGYWNAPRTGDAFASGIFAADRGALHLEARANYEAVHAQSAFAGWTFSGGDAVKVEATPIVGAVTGATRGPIVGLEAAVSAGRFDAYVEAEHVHPTAAGQGAYTYAWTEVGWRPAEWIRLGAVGQRTRVYGADRSGQGGAFVQLSRGKLTLSAYGFSPGRPDQLLVIALGVSY